MVDKDSRLTYAELGEMAMRFGRGLPGLRATVGDRVACVLPNTAPTRTTHFEVPLARAVFVADRTHHARRVNG